MGVIAGVGTESGCCALFDTEGESEDGSAQRGNQIAQSHFRYASWQSAHDTIGLYSSRPQAMVVRDIVKLVRVSSSSSTTASSMLLAEYAIAGKSGSVMGTVYPIDGQYGKE